MGFLQMGASHIRYTHRFVPRQYLGWHAPFLWIAAMAVLVTMLIAVKLQPITKHLAVQHDKSALHIYGIPLPKEITALGLPQRHCQLWFYDDALAAPFH
jgi:hypothetical protein